MYEAWKHVKIGFKSYKSWAKEISMQFYKIKRFVEFCFFSKTRQKPSQPLMGNTKSIWHSLMTYSNTVPLGMEFGITLIFPC